MLHNEQYYNDLQSVDTEALRIIHRILHDRRSTGILRRHSCKVVELGHFHLFRSAQVCSNRTVSRENAPMLLRPWGNETCRARPSLRNDHTNPWGSTHSGTIALESDPCTSHKRCSGVRCFVGTLNVPVRIHAKKASSQCIPTFGIVSVRNTGRGDAVFISEPKVSPQKIGTIRRAKANVQDGKNRLCGFNGTIHRSTKFEEYVGRIVDHVRLVVTRLALRFNVKNVRTWIQRWVHEPGCMDAVWKDSSRTGIECR